MRLCLTLSAIFDWKSRQIDYVQAFPQAKLHESEKVYVEIPRDFYVHKEADTKHYALKLNKNVYGLKQASHNWWEMLSTGLKIRKFHQSPIDPCLFIRTDCIVIVYVDDTLIFAKDNNTIQSVIDSLSQDFELTDEGTMENFLGCNINKGKNGEILLTQPGIKERILNILHLTEECKRHSIPISQSIVDRMHEKSPRVDKWNYRSAIGMLTYLAQISHPEISYAVHLLARHVQDPQLVHEQGVKHIGRYLKGCISQGLILNPKRSDFTLEAYVDADFAGLYHKDNCNTPDSVYRELVM